MYRNCLIVPLSYILFYYAAVLLLNNGIGSDGDEDDVSDLALAVKSRQENIKRRKKEEQKERNKQEQDRLKEDKFREQQAKIINQRKKEEQLKTDVDMLLMSIKNEPLGLDRNYNRYWLFSGTPGLYVEQGWWQGNYFKNIEKKSNGSLDTSNNSETSEDSGVNTLPEPVIVPVEDSAAWYVVPSLQHYEDLKSSLNKRGVREKALLQAFTREEERIKTAIRKMNYPSKVHRLIGNVEATMKTLKKDIITMDTSLAYAGLGGVDNMAKQLKSCTPTTEQLSLAMLAIQESVDAKYVTKPMCSVYNPSDLTFAYHERVQVWRDMTSAAVTLSDLHMLLSVFDNCIKWERSIENITCKSCKKKGDERKLLICDVCDTGYHCGCLRPPLKKVPEDEWLCPDCAPEVEDEEDNGNESGECSEAEQQEEEEANDDYCCICESGGELILCDKCPSAYHLQCHDPKLKRVPRGDWACYDCMENKSEIEQTSGDESGDEVDNCSVCDKGGNLIVCHECEQTFHMKCHNPPIKAVPGKKWKCSLCKPEETKTKKRSSSNSNRGKPGKKRKVEKVKKTRVKELQSEDDEKVKKTRVKELQSEDDEKVKKTRVKELQSEDDETTGTEEDNENEEDEDLEDDEDYAGNKRSSRSKQSTKKAFPSGKRASRPKTKPSKSKKREKRSENRSKSADREDRSNRRSLKRGQDHKLEICEQIISDILKLPESADFIDLVDKKKVPDYYDLIVKPICLSQVKEKTLYLQYETSEEFIEDILTLLENCFSYNIEQSEVYENGKVLEKAVHSMIKSRLPDIHRTIVKSQRKS